MSNSISLASLNSLALSTDLTYAHIIFMIISIIEKSNFRCKKKLKSQFFIHNNKLFTWVYVS